MLLLLASLWVVVVNAQLHSFAERIEVEAQVIYVNVGEFDLGGQLLLLLLLMLMMFAQ